MKAKKVKFAQATCHFTAEGWNEVMYSDESTFKCSGTSRAKIRRLQVN
jgi:hypothetical protein